jgi:hypothetical protein
VREDAALRQYIDKNLLVFHPEFEDLEAVAARLAERSTRYGEVYKVADVHSLARRIGAVFADFCGCPRDPILAGAGALVFSETLDAVVSLGESSRIV